jgi:hypothetical protein
LQTGGVLWATQHGETNGKLRAGQGRGSGGEWDGGSSRELGQGDGNRSIGASYRRRTAS